MRLGWILELIVVVALFATAAYAQSPSAPIAAQPPAPAGAILSFQAWKAERVDEARAALDRLQLEQSVDRLSTNSASGKTAGSAQTTAGLRAIKVDARLEQRIAQAEKNLEFAKGLGMDEFLNIYIVQLKSRETVMAAAKRMTPEDMTEVLLAFQRLATAANQGSDHVSVAGDSRR